MMKVGLLVSRRHHVSHLHVLSSLSHFGAYFTAKMRCATVTISQAKRRRAVTDDDVDMSEAEGDICNRGMVFLNRDVRCDFSDVFSGKKKSRATLGNPQAVDADGLLVDVDVQPVDDNSPTREDRRQDVDHFFCTAVVKEVKGKLKKY
jgi:hypothetical protein